MRGLRAPNKPTRSHSLLSEKGGPGLSISRLPSLTKPAIINNFFAIPGRAAFPLAPPRAAILGLISDHGHLRYSSVPKQGARIAGGTTI